jgi:hypothetical protein
MSGRSLSGKTMPHERAAFDGSQTAANLGILASQTFFGPITFLEIAHRIPE